MTTLAKGQRITATTTGSVHGQRIFTEREFTISRDQEPEPFIRKYGAPPQDRIFVEQATRHAEVISVPALVVTGSIRAVAA